MGDVITKSVLKVGSATIAAHMGKGTGENDQAVSGRG